MTYFSTNRDENDRVLFWSNSPNDLVRPGVLGDFVDIDECGFITSNASRIYGHSFDAIDARPGVLQQMKYLGGTTDEKFYILVVLVLLPSLRSTG